MPAKPNALPVIDRPDVAAVLITTATTDGHEGQHAVAEAITKHWRAGVWPDELISLTCYLSTDGKSVLTYAQWNDEAALRKSLADDDGISRLKPAVDANWASPIAFELYRVVRGSAVTKPAPVPECFPAAVFTMKDNEQARQWIDDILSAEEASEGEERDYPGALAANFHVGLDGGTVLVLSEWISEAEAVAHIEAVWEPILAQMGNGDAGSRYTHHLTLTGPDPS